MRAAEGDERIPSAGPHREHSFWASVGKVCIGHGTIIGQESYAMEPMATLHMVSTTHNRVHFAILRCGMHPAYR